MISFAADPIIQQGRSNQMIYVLNIEDGGGKEFFLATSGKLVGLSESTDEQPQEFKALKQVLKKRDELRPKYHPVCRIYAIELTEFTNRRQLLQKPKA